MENGPQLLYNWSVLLHSNYVTVQGKIKVNETELKAYETSKVKRADGYYIYTESGPAYCLDKLTNKCKQQGNLQFDIAAAFLKGFPKEWRKLCFSEQKKKRMKTLNRMLTEGSYSVTSPSNVNINGINLSMLNARVLLTRLPPDIFNKHVQTNFQQACITKKRPRRSNTVKNLILKSTSDLDTNLKFRPKVETSKNSHGNLKTDKITPEVTKRIRRPPTWLTFCNNKKMPSNGLVKVTSPKMCEKQQKQVLNNNTPAKRNNRKKKIPKKDSKQIENKVIRTNEASPIAATLSTKKVKVLAKKGSYKRRQQIQALKVHLTTCTSPKNDLFSDVKNFPSGCEKLFPLLPSLKTKVLNGVRDSISTPPWFQIPDPGACDTPDSGSDVSLLNDDNLKKHLKEVENGGKIVARIMNEKRKAPKCKKSLTPKTGNLIKQRLKLSARRELKLPYNLLKPRTISEEDYSDGDEYFDDFSSSED